MRRLHYLQQYYCLRHDLHWSLLMEAHLLCDPFNLQVQYFYLVHVAVMSRNVVSQSEQC